MVGEGSNQFMEEGSNGSELYDSEEDYFGSIEGDADDDLPLLSPLNFSSNPTPRTHWPFYPLMPCYYGYTPSAAIYYHPSYYPPYELCPFYAPITSTRPMTASNFTPTPTPTFTSASRLQPTLVSAIDWLRESSRQATRAVQSSHSLAPSTDPSSTSKSPSSNSFKSNPFHFQVSKSISACDSGATTKLLPLLGDISDPNKEPDPISFRYYAPPPSTPQPVKVNTLGGPLIAACKGNPLRLYFFPLKVTHCHQHQHQHQN